MDTKRQRNHYLSARGAGGRGKVERCTRTVWLSQVQMVSLFGRDQSVISRHIGNVFKEEELVRVSTMQKMHSANSDRPVDFYNENQ